MVTILLQIQSITSTNQLVLRFHLYLPDQAALVNIKRLYHIIGHESKFYLQTKKHDNIEIKLPHQAFEHHRDDDHCRRRQHRRNQDFEAHSNAS